MIVAGRYAKSLMEIAHETNSVEAVRADMHSIENLCEKNHEFLMFLESPVIQTEKKLSVINAIFKGKVSDITLSFLNLMTRKSRESILKEIAHAFGEQYKTDKNILTAVVTSASGLDDKTRQKMLDLIKSQTKGEVELIEKTDAKAIGGFVLKIGDRQIDKTVARQLSNMKKQLLNKELN